MVFAILQCIAVAGVGLSGILLYAGVLDAFGDVNVNDTVLIVLCVYLIALLIFEIWTIIVAKRARQEIAEETAPTNDASLPKV